ncbi:uncharacterized protein CC84DRAFT_1173390 [Paraphaeosphaeria sporulosa]|uniref:Uncharacterized protein n=1 Tax=Paraphaeosphaeria sporulosa TaxID=1460663 RepID=A0A177CVQ5_9PLEO|nr:uncharacterized protein CC84DRAFT_1173390 [Paraphaeosphaeria sporulosa]OAG11108.1 hypothetical protein CC84DRAFT_1173390 [Paraphaeosphaeria sporulosa]
MGRRPLWSSLRLLQQALAGRSTTRSQVPLGPRNRPHPTMWLHSWALLHGHASARGHRAPPRFQSSAMLFESTERAPGSTRRAAYPSTLTTGSAREQGHACRVCHVQDNVYASEVTDVLDAADIHALGLSRVAPYRAGTPTPTTSAPGRMSDRRHHGQPSAQLIRPPTSWTGSGRSNDQVSDLEDTPLERSSSSRDSHPGTHQPGKLQSSPHIQFELGALQETSPPSSPDPSLSRNASTDGHLPERPMGAISPRCNGVANKSSAGQQATQDAPEVPNILANDDGEGILETIEEGFDVVMAQGSEAESDSQPRMDCSSVNRGPNEDHVEDDLNADEIWSIISSLESTRTTAERSFTMTAEQRTVHNLTIQISHLQLKLHSLSDLQMAACSDQVGMLVEHLQRLRQKFRAQSKHVIKIEKQLEHWAEVQRQRKELKHEDGQSSDLNTNPEDHRHPFHHSSHTMAARLHAISPQGTDVLASGENNARPLTSPRPNIHLVAVGDHGVGRARTEQYWHPTKRSVGEQAWEAFSTEQDGHHDISCVGEAPWTQEDYADVLEHGSASFRGAADPQRRAWSAKLTNITNNDLWCAEAEFVEDQLFDKANHSPTGNEATARAKALDALRTMEEQGRNKVQSNGAGSAEINSPQTDGSRMAPPLQAMASSCIDWHTCLLQFIFAFIATLLIYYLFFVLSCERG